MAERAKKVVLNDKLLRSLAKKKHPGEPKRIFIYDAVLPGLDVMWTPPHRLSFGMIQRWPKQKSTSWRRLGAVYLPARDEPQEEKKSGEEEITDGALTIVEARTKGRRWLDMLSRGIDPAAEAKKVREENRHRYTFAELRDEHIKHHWKRNKLAKASEAERLLRREFGAWDDDDRPAADITAADVDEAIQAIVARGAPYQAHNAFGYLRGLYTWAIGNPRYGIKTSPVAGLSPVKMIGAKRSRTRWLSDKELREVWNAAGELGTAGKVIRLLCLTPQRLNEIAGMPRSEIDLDKGEIIIRCARKDVKNKVDLLVPICPKVRAILEPIKKGERGDYVFSTTGGAKPMTIGSKIKNKLDGLLNWHEKLDQDGEDENAWIWPDLRRTVRSNFSKLGIREEIRELLMGHVKAGLIKTYDMYDWRDEKRDALMKWEARLMAIVEPPALGVTDFDAERERRAVS